MRRQRGLAPGTRRLIRNRRLAAAQLGLPATSWQVKRQAFLITMHERYEVRLCEGADVPIDGLAKINQQMAEILATLPAKPMTVRLEIVEGPVEKCPSCGWCRNDAAPVSEAVDVTPRLLPPPVEAAAASRPIYGMLDDGYWASASSRQGKTVTK